MTIPKGGRGKKAPYETQQMRVPTPIKDQVNILIAKFRGGVLNDPKTDDDLFDFANNSKTSEELESLQTEMENLKTALEVGKAEKLNLSTALQEANQQIENLSTGLVDSRSDLLNLSTSLEEARQQLEKLKTGKIASFNVGETIGEAEALDYYKIGRNILRRPREKGKTTVSFKTNDISVTLEYLGQPEGKGKQHFWKIIDLTNQLPLN